MPLMFLYSSQNVESEKLHPSARRRGLKSRGQVANQVVLSVAGIAVIHSPSRRFGCWWACHVMNLSVRYVDTWVAWRGIT